MTPVDNPDPLDLILKRLAALEYEVACMRDELAALEAKVEALEGMVAAYEEMREEAADWIGGTECDD